MRFINIRVVSGAKSNRIKKEQDRFRAYLTAPAIEGRANKALIEMLSEHFDVKKSQVLIVKGQKTKDKIVKIL